MSVPREGSERLLPALGLLQAVLQTLCSADLGRSYCTNVLSLVEVVGEVSNFGVVLGTPAYYFLGSWG